MPDGGYMSDWISAIKLSLGTVKKTSTNNPDAKKLFTKAKQYFGVTHNLKLAGYILPDGSLLNLSSGGYDRDRDHRSVMYLLQKSGFEIPSESGSGTLYMRAFMEMGAIRINGEYGNIDIATPPTGNQERILGIIFSKNDGEIELEVSDNDYGRATNSYTKGTSPARILKDIAIFYRTGNLPERSEFRERKFSHGNKRQPLGPHTLIELELMLSGKKPAAVIYEHDPNFKGFLPYISNGTLYSESFIDNNGTSVYFITLPSEKWRARKLKKIYIWKENLKAKYGDAFRQLIDKKTLQAYHTKIGVLLGYSNEDIRYFLKKQRLKELEYPMAKGEDMQSYQGEEGWKGKVVWMTPDKFLSLVHPLPERFKNDDSMKNLEDRMKKGLPVDFLVLGVDMEKRKITGHEGRHRATVAKKLGIEKVPVLIWTGHIYPRVPTWTPDIHAAVDAVDFKPEYSK